MVAQGTHLGFAFMNGRLDTFLSGISLPSAIRRMLGRYMYRSLNSFSLSQFTSLWIVRDLYINNIKRKKA